MSNQRGQSSGSRGKPQGRGSGGSNRSGGGSNRGAGGSNRGGGGSNRGGGGSNRGANVVHDRTSQNAFFHGRGGPRPNLPNLQNSHQGQQRQHPSMLSSCIPNTPSFSERNMVGGAEFSCNPAIQLSLFQLQNAVTVKSETHYFSSKNAPKHGADHSPGPPIHAGLVNPSPIQLTAERITRPILLSTPLQPFQDQRKFQRSTSSTSNTSQASSAKNMKKKYNKNYRKPNQKYNNFWRNRKKNTEMPASDQQSLFSFVRATQSPAASVLSEDSDDDSSSVVSGYSYKNGIDEAEDSDVATQDSDHSNESELSSIFSGKDASDLHDFEIIEKSDIPYPSRVKLGRSRAVESFVSVYWDIENCSVPNNKSAIDIVKKVRDKFYEHRTEDAFIVACDTRNLSTAVDRDLAEAHVNILHASSQNKNAADVKLQEFLRKFQFKYRNTNSAIVLISGDSDFSQFLCELRYQHNIYINLICNEKTRKSLQVAAHRVEFFSDFISDLPNRLKDDDLQYYLAISNLPDHVRSNAIKAALAEKIKSINGRIKVVSSTEAEIVFSNHSACEKAFKELQGCTIYESPIRITLKVRHVSTSSAVPTNSKAKKRSHSTVSESSEVKPSAVINSPEANPPIQLAEKHLSKKDVVCGSQSKSANNVPVSKKEKKIDSDKTDDLSKNATMYVFVPHRFGDQPYWEREFHRIFSNRDIVVQWLENEFERYFLITFGSLSKAQKAKKILTKLQVSNPEAPRFIKIVKETDSIHESVSEVVNSRQLMEKNIENHVQYIKTREAKCLEEYRANLKELKETHGKKNSSEDEKRAFQDKCNELNEQKVTFTAFTDSICQKLKALSGCENDVEDKIRDFMREYSRECACLRTGLPVYGKKNMIVKKIKTHQIVILQAETGSGKSTQICQYLWRENFGETGMIVCTQPRKIAAISIAKHVSTQVGCSLGGIVGYQVGLAKRMSPETKILYVTDFTMLKMCVDNPLFEGISCIMIDEAHERSVYTDLLLGMVKKAAVQRPDLHVIVTSATIQSSLFKKYFSLPDAAVIQISGRTFPIEDFWLETDVSLGWDYLGKCVDVTFDILLQEPGDVLVFLPTPAETEKAVQLLNERLQERGIKLNVRALSLHGKLDIGEQQKVFEKTPQNTRKVVFSTNCAETSLTIPGIKYVVDCGMVKEAQYDPVRNLNVLSVGFTNKSSAEQRRGRAGRTQSGKCYRLYSSSNYVNNMSDSMVPEILRVNLGQAILKLMTLGITDPTSFDFVESPSPEALSAAFKQLTHLGAISLIDRSLSELGRKMSCLPLEPRLCHLILKGIEQGIAYDAVIIAALATVSRNIFFRNSENQKEADIKKVRFCQSESDFFTFYEIYKEWFEVPKKGKSRWCVINCINARSLTLVQDLVSELIQTLSKELNYTVSTKFTKQDNFVEVMHELIFMSFSENICIFSGHNNFGYLSPNIPGKLYIHPCSSLYSLGKWRPEYIVYDTILKTSQTFLLNITVVKETTVKKAYFASSLFADIHQLKSKILVPYSFSQLGEVVLKTVLGKRGFKLKGLEEQLKKEINSEQCIAEVDFPKGRLSIFVSKEHHPKVETVFSPSIKETQLRLFGWEQEIKDAAGLSCLRMIVGAGFEVREILLPSEFREVKVSPANCNFPHVLESLRSCGNIVHISSGAKFHRVLFHNAASAKAAITMFKNVENIKVEPMQIPAYNPSLPFFKILIHFVRRKSMGLAFFNVQPPECLPEVLYCLSSHSLVYNNNSLKVTKSKKNLDDLCIHNLPPVIKRQELKTILEQKMPPGVTINKLIVPMTKEFQSSETDIDNIRNDIIQIFSQFTPVNKLHVDLKTPKPKDSEWKAIVYCENPQDGQTAVNVINSRKQNIAAMQQSIITLSPLLETSMTCNQKIYHAIEDEIKKALEYYKKESVGNDKLEINAKRKDDGNVLIQVSSNNIRDITDVQRTLVNFMKGDPISCGGNPFLEKLLTDRGQSFLRDCSLKYPPSYINIDVRNKIVSIFGSDTICTIIKSAINEYLDVIAKENFEEIQLLSTNSRRSVLKEVIKQYGSDLKSLCTTCNLSSAEINVYKHVLTVCGSRESTQQCKELIAKMHAAAHIDDIAQTDSNILVEECPVCRCEPDDDSHRLEYCGHLYCTGCLSLQIKNSDTFPIKCCKEECMLPIVWEDIQRAMKQGKIPKKGLESRALEHFMKNSTVVKYCPTPDCPMVYKVTFGEEYPEFVCPQCYNSICTRCCVPYHAGMSCKFYDCFKNNNDHSLEVWLKLDPENHKKCPSCNSPIEKNGGCMHMTCWKCGCHMCWRCMKVFQSGDQVYDHQANCPAMLRAMFN